MHDGAQVAQAESARGPLPTSDDGGVDQLRTLGELEERGIRVASEQARLYGRSGAGEEVTVARNREAFRHLALRSRVLRDVRTVDTSATVVGVPVELPVLLAPVGSLALFHPNGAAEVARGAVRAGTSAVIGILSEPSYQEAVEAAGAPQMFQLYTCGDRGWIRSVLDRITDIGCRAIAVTVDSPGHSRRDQLLRSGADFRMEREGEPPNLAGLGRDRSYQLNFTWEDLEWLRGEVQLPLLLKGVMDPEDARRAAELGVDAIYVSNHGGRELDHALSTIEVLPEIVDAVGDTTEVLLDGGIRRGTDVVKAIALGACAVAVGRPQCWALAAGGAEGVAHLLDLLRREIRSTMTMMGCRSLEELRSGSVHRSFSPPTEMSSV
jgi:isopentenyl diphosphate isomerase/L-lactate dehydrogenase-like FMN-dependent dehydrogenase